MKLIDHLFNCIGQLIANNPYLFNAIKSYALKHPYFNIENSDGTPYMDRWWLLPHWALKPDENGHPYPKKWVLFKPRLHHIRSADYDRGFHDHPADFRTFICRNWYVEQDFFGTSVLRNQGTSLKVRAEVFHKIIEVPEDGTWTIFILNKKRNEWGFIKDNFKISWREYSK